VQNLDQGGRVVDILRETRPVRRAVIVGAGYIGVEMAEALCSRGLQVTLLQRSGEPLNTLDPEMGALVRSGLSKLGADVVCGAEVTGFETGADGWVEAVVAGSTAYPADLVILGMGIEPASELAVEAGLPVGETGGVRTDDRMTVTDGIWAAGDCVEVRHRVTGRQAFVPLGTHANKQGRVIGRNLTGGAAVFPGVVGTAITRVGDLEVARTGLSLRQAEAAGFAAVAETVETSTISGYMPESERMHLRMVAERGSGRLLGTQIVGGSGSAKRIDVCAMALWQEMTVGDLGMTDLAYAPPFSSVWDPVLVGAWKVARSV
jgi:NADPH-dependent 2,4-dienoyl-CoA reductase/sulfur reductase-like enzyme